MNLPHDLFLMRHDKTRLVLCKSLDTLELFLSLLILVYKKPKVRKAQKTPLIAAEMT